MQLLSNPIIRSFMIFFAVTMAFDFASRTILKPKAAPSATATSSSVDKTEGSPTDEPTDMSFEEKAIENGNIVGEETEIYTFTAEFCDCCGLRKQFETIKEQMEKYKNIIFEDRVVPKPTKKRIIQTFFTLLQFVLIALTLCKNYFIFFSFV